MHRAIKIGSGVVIALVVIIVAAFAVGVIGVPSLSGVDNQFGDVNETNTVIYTDLHVNNPNPVGVQLGGLSINYSVAMNGVDIANGQREGVAVNTGNSTLNLTTRMDNRQIPEWWYTHVRNDETTEVNIDATADTSLGQTSFGRSEMIETDIVGEFDSNETRPVDANAPLVRDPVLYVNSTRGSWDRENLTREQTPLALDFTVYNPKAIPYTVSRVGYDITMNDVAVGSGETQRERVIESQTTETINANTVIRNENLDEWWVTHLDRNQVTELYVDFYIVVEIQGEEFRVDLDEIDYEKVIETDIFGNKPTTGNQTAEGTTTETQTSTATDDGVLDEEPLTDSTATDGDLVETDNEIVETDTQTGTETNTATATETDGGIIDETTDDGL